MRAPTAEDRAHQEILKLIVSQKYAPGDRLVESELAEELGLSRTPGRNALRKLLAEGVLESEKGVGCSIPRLTPSDMEGVFQARILLESRAAAIAAKTASWPEIERLQKLLEEERSLYTSGEMDRYTRINEQLHLGITALSKNDYIERFARQVFWRSELYIFFFDRFYANRAPREELLRDPEQSRSCREHAQLLESIVARDPKGAEEAMRVHVTSTYQTLTQRVTLF